MPNRPPPGAPRPGTAARNRKRDAEIRQMHAAGFTLSRIAARYQLTDARVWQIINDYRRAKPQPPRDDD